MCGQDINLSRGKWKEAANMETVCMQILLARVNKHIL